MHCVCFAPTGMGRAADGLVRDGLVRSATVLCPKAPFLRTADDGSLYHDLRQRRLVFVGQSSEGAGRAKESTAEKELRADE